MIYKTFTLKYLRYSQFAPSLPGSLDQPCLRLPDMMSVAVRPVNAKAASERQGLVTIGRRSYRRYGNA